MAITLGGTARTTEDVHRLARLGLGLAEVGIPDPESFVQRAVEYNAAAMEAGIGLWAHGSREGDPNDVDHLEGTVLPRLERCLDLLPIMGASYLTVHLWLDSRHVEPKAISAKIRILERLVRRAGALSVVVGLENLSEAWEDLDLPLREIPDLCLTLDLGHGQLLTERNRSFDIIERFPERIRHLHVHDNLGGWSYKDDLHLPLGEGVVPFEELFRALRRIRFDGTATLELTVDQIVASLPLVKRWIGAEPDPA